MDKISYSKLPKWLKIVISVILALSACIGTIVALDSCGTPRTAVTITDGGTSKVESNTTSTSTTTITISSNPKK